MRKREFLGGFELLVLLAVIRLGDEAYGVPIADAIEESSGREVALGSVYITLDRLEAKGIVSSRLGEPTPERGGRATVARGGDAWPRVRAERWAVEGAALIGDAERRRPIGGAASGVLAERVGESRSAENSAVR